MFIITDTMLRCSTVLRIIIDRPRFYGVLQCSVFIVTDNDLQCSVFIVADHDFTLLLYNVVSIVAHHDSTVLY